MPASRSIATCLITALAAFICGSPAHATEQKSEPATLILTNARVYTVNPQQPWAEAVVVSGEDIAYVGDTQTALKWSGETTQIIDLTGQMLLPGFQDSHLHLLWGGETLRSCNLGEADTPESVRDTLLACSKEPGRGEENWLIGRVWERTSFADGMPPAGFLDELFPDVPVAIEASDGHSLWANALALEITGINQDTLNPPNGVIFREPETGVPTGMLSGSAINLLMKHVPKATQQENMRTIQAAVGLAHAHGITSAIEPGLGAQQARAFHALASENALGIRMQLCLAPSGWEIDQFGPEVFDFLDQVPETESPLITQDCVKLFIDGALEAETAAMRAPYLGETEPFPAFYTRGELTAILRGLEERQISAHLHAIGDAATELALESFAAVRPADGFTSRPVITHLQFVTGANTPRFGELGVAASFTPYWMYPDDYTREIYPGLVGMEKNLSAYPVKDIQAAGGRVLGSSDWSVSSIDPLLGIETAMTRQDPLTNSGMILGQSQRLDLPTMIAAYTINVAWAMGRDNQTGSIEVGKKADLVVLDQDLFELSPYEISDVKVTRTVFGGETVWQLGE